MDARQRYVEALRRAVGLNNNVFGITGGQPDKNILRALAAAIEKGHEAWTAASGYLGYGTHDRDDLTPEDGWRRVLVIELPEEGK